MNDGPDQEASGVPARPGTDAEHPASVRWVADSIRDWIKKLGQPWIEGQIAQISRRQEMAFITLRDLSADYSMTVTAHGSVLKQAGQLEAGERIVVNARVEYWAKRGDLVLRAVSIRKVGIGEWLAQLEKLRTLLDAEGLFRPERKRPLPFLPTKVGLISGRDSDAERDVVVNARRRWPTVEFVIRNTAVQGPRAVSEVTAALQELAGMGDVDVIVIARGGGSVEDLLPFSNETLVRAVAATSTPVVSAIGHERDNPILDLVADVRASTPTDAGKRIVPDFAEQVRQIRDLRVRARRDINSRVQQEQVRLDNYVNRPVLARPLDQIELRGEDLATLRGRGQRSLLARVDHDRTELRHLRSRVRALSPAATLDRGYAVVQTDAGHVIRDPTDALPDALLRIRVAAGEFEARTMGKECPL